MAKIGKRYVKAAEAASKPSGSPTGWNWRRPSRWPRPTQRPSSTRPWTWRCGWCGPKARRPDGPGNGRASERDGKESPVLVSPRARKRKRPRRRVRTTWGRRTCREDPGGWLDFDRAIATPDVMGLVVAWARSWARGLMPNPRPAPSLSRSASGARVQGGKIEFRVEKAGIVHVPFGKASFTPQQLTDNALAFWTPCSGQARCEQRAYLQGVSISSTMGPGVRSTPTPCRPW